MSETATHSTSLARGLDEFGATRARTLAMARGLTQKELDFVPAANRWSIGEVLDHMVLAEGINRDQISQLVELKKAGRTPRLNLSFSDLNISVAYLPRSVLPILELPLTLMNMLVPDSLRNYLTRNRLVPFQNPDAAAPRRGRTASALISDLTDSLEQTRALFQRNAHLDFAEMVLTHPLLGSYDVPGLIRFMSAHEQRHQSQVADVLKTLRSQNQRGRRCDGLGDTDENILRA